MQKQTKKILLASASPRRKQLLQETGFAFSLVHNKKVNEDIPPHLKGKEAAIYLAKIKADAYAEYITDNVLLITADTIVCLADEILGKPKDKNKAVEILKKLSGKAHKVITGISMRTIDKQIVFADETSVVFKPLSDEEINYYIENYKPFDKAGAYGIQEWIGYIGIKEIKGSYYNVMGLPVHKIYENIQKF